jgi:hypothetical protein
MRSDRTELSVESGTVIKYRGSYSDHCRSGTRKWGSMAPALGRLKAALIAGKIDVTDKALEVLRAELTTIGHGYWINRCIGEAKTDTELKKDLSRLQTACRTVVEVFDADLSGAGQIEAMLSDPWRGSQVPRLVEELRSLSSRIETALAMAKQDGAIRKRQQDPETSFFLAVHDLFSRLTGNPEPWVAGPLHRFTRNCATLTHPSIVVPESENSFQKRLKAALARRTGKMSAHGNRDFPGK